MIFIGGVSRQFIDLGEVFVFLFVTLGPLHLLKPFGDLTKNADAALVRNLAFRATVIATISLLLASFVGMALLKRWLISDGALAMSVGIVLFLVAIKSVFALYGDRPAESEPAAPSPALAWQIAVPGIATPYGVGTLILFMTLAPQAKWAILGLLLAIMVLDLLAMLFVRPLLHVLAMPLRLLGIVLAVLQVALSVQVVLFAIRVVLANGS